MSIIVVVVGIGVAWVFLNAPQAAVTCAPALELQLVEHFKMDVFVCGMIGAIFAVAPYYTMLRYQVFFPGLDIKRFAAATIAGVTFALSLTIIDYRSGSQCLQKALGPNSSIVAEIPSIDPTLFGHVVSNVWLAIFLDHLLYALFLIALVKGLRWVSLRGRLI